MDGFEQQGGLGDVADDPVLVQRERMRRLAQVGQRAGYLCFAVAMVVFVVAFVAGPSGATTALVIGALVVGSLLLAPAIVLGYAVRAAAREDRERASHDAARDRPRTQGEHR